MSDYDCFQQTDWIGFAHFYLQRCSTNIESDDETDIEVYTRLVQLDSRLGTTATEQLLQCIFYSLRLELLKV